MATKVYGDSMLLHRYLETLLGSKTKIKILRTLHRHEGKEFTIRELSNFINTSHTGVQKALQDLYEMNAVTLKAVGRSHTVSLKEESHLTPILTSLFNYEEETIRELQKDIRKHLCHEPTIKQVKIFGSVARGQEEPRSDIDLLIITSDREKTEEILTGLQILCNNKYGNPIIPHIIAEDEKSSQSLIEEIQDKHITICEKTREIEYV
ncbi:MAG: nucleotidyltransferase domain-containing protein [Candidatus Bathyarchaeota archaeon]